MRTLFCALLVVLMASPALAGTITFDPFPGIPADVTVQYFDGGLTGPLATLPTPNAEALTSTLSAIPGGGNALLTYPYGVLFTFNSSQNFVKMVGNDFGGNPVQDNEVVHLTAFDSGGSLIGHSTFAGPWGDPDLKPVSFSGSDIKYAAFTWEVDLGYYAVDNVEYTSAVPLPGTLMLLNSGLLVLGAVSWRRRCA